MKTTFKLSALALVFSLSVVGCDPSKAPKEKKDTVATSTVTKVVDTVIKDSTGATTPVSSDTTVVKKMKKTETKKM